MQSSSGVKAVVRILEELRARTLNSEPEPRSDWYPRSSKTVVSPYARTIAWPCKRNG